MQLFLWRSVTLAVCLLTFGAQASKSKVITLTGAAEGTYEDGKSSMGSFSVNSHLVEAGGECVLFDGQFTIADARRVAGIILDNCKKLNAIVITHEHPDHYWGVGAIKQAFRKHPFASAPVISSAEVLKSMQAVFPGKYDFWGPVYGNQILAKGDIVFPEATSLQIMQDKITVDGNYIELIPLVSGESDVSIAAYIPAASALINGDAVFNKVHLWLAKSHSLNEWESKLAAWRKNLATLKSKKTEFVYAGHSKARALPEKGLVNDDYLTFVNELLTKQNASNSRIFDLTTARFRDYILPAILNLSLNTISPEPTPK